MQNRAFFPDVCTLNFIELFVYKKKIYIYMCNGVKIIFVKFMHTLDKLAAVLMHCCNHVRYVLGAVPCNLQQSLDVSLLTVMHHHWAAIFINQWSCLSQCVYLRSLEWPPTRLFSVVHPTITNTYIYIYIHVLSWAATIVEYVIPFTKKTLDYER